jgi:hypothetical protein
MRPSLAISLALVGLAGCDETQRTTLADVRSPDGLWVARVTQEQHFGPGNAAVFSIVDLLRAGDKRPVEVLMVEQQDAQPDHLRVAWLDPHHLEVRYRDAQVDFQAVKAAGLDITTIAVR